MVAIVVALVFGLSGVVFLGLMLRERNAVAGSVSAGGLTLQVQSAEWVDMEHSHDPGFQMPQAMTPGAPGPDQQRLAVEVAVSNRGSAEQLFSDSEFSVQSLNGQAWPLMADNLSDKHLGPGLGVTGSLTFDLPAASVDEANKGLFLLWSRAGKVVRVPVTVGGTAAHVHE
jgi:hypothetical protein